MNIFIDSNALYKDYYFEKLPSKKMLEYAKEGHLTLFMSDVVLRELRKQYEKEVLENNKVISNLIRDANRLHYSLKIKELDVDSLLEIFDDFYNQLQMNDGFKILKYKDEFLTEIVDRAIDKRKPFSEEKTELKDAIIWRTYYQYAEQNALENCIFLTNNTSDFCSKKDKTKMHEDLEKDSGRFSVVNNFYSFIHKYSREFDTPESKLKAYINRINFNDELVIHLLVSNFASEIDREVRAFIEDKSVNELFNNSYWYDGHVICNNVEIESCSNSDYQYVTESILVSCIIHIACEIEAYQYNSCRDPEDEKFTLVDDETISLKMTAIFELKRGGKCSSFEVLATEIF